MAQQSMDASIQQLASETVARAARLTRSGVDLYTPSQIDTVLSPTRHRVSLSVTSPGASSAFRLDSSAGAVDLASCFILVTILPQFDATQLNAPDDFNIPSATTAGPFAWGAWQQTVAGADGRSTMLFANPADIFQTIDIQVGGGSNISRYIGEKIPFGLQTIMDRVIDGVPNQAILHTFDRSNNVVWSPAGSEKLAQYPMTDNNAFHALIPLQDSLVFKKGRFLTDGTVVVNYTINADTETGIGRAFLRNPTVTSTQTNRITTNIAQIELYYDTYARSSPTIAQLRDVAGLLGALPQKVIVKQIFHRPLSQASSTNFDESVSGGAIRGVMLIPVHLDVAESAAINAYKKDHRTVFRRVSKWKTLALTVGDHFNQSGLEQQTFNYSTGEGAAYYHYQNFRKLVDADRRPEDAEALSYTNWLQHYACPTWAIDYQGQEIFQDYPENLRNVNLSFQADEAITNMRVMVVLIKDSAFAFSPRGAVAAGNLRPLPIGSLFQYTENQIRSAANQVNPIQ